MTSFDSLRHAWQTLDAQNWGEREWLARNGQRLGDVFFHRAGERFVDDPRGYFEKIVDRDVGFQTEPGPSGPEPAPPAYEETSLGYFERIVALCRTEGIDLRIVLTPAHVHELEIAAAVNAWPRIEDGKRELVRLLAADAARHPGSTPFPLWDFSRYSAITTEPLPEPGSRAEMKYYWDPSHFKETVGDMVLDRVFGVSRPERPVPADFGQRLTSETIEAAIAQDLLGQAAYRAAHRGDVDRIRTLVARALAP
jgi:hypothetical protein